MAPGLFAAMAVALLTLLGVGTRYYFIGDLNVIHALLSLFISTNLVVCYWEICLFLKRDYIEERTEYWRTRRNETGRTPAVEFLLTRVPMQADPVTDGLGRCLGHVFPGRRVFLGSPHVGIQCGCRERVLYSVADPGPLRGPYAELHAGGRGRHARAHALLAVDLRHDGLLGQLLYGQAAASHHQGRTVHLSSAR